MDQYLGLFHMECDDRNDQFNTKIWFGTADGAPTGNPDSYSDTIPFASQQLLLQAQSMRYHNVISNEVQ